MDFENKRVKWSVVGNVRDMFWLSLLIVYLWIKFDAPCIRKLIFTLDYADFEVINISIFIYAFMSIFNLISNHQNFQIPR